MSRQGKKNGITKIICSNPKCDKNLEEERIGKQRYCKSCHAEYMRQNRKKHSQLYRKLRELAND